MDALLSFKRLISSALLLLTISAPFAKAQNIVILYPIEDAVTTSQLPATNWGSHNQLSAYAWTQGGQFALHRSFLKFDYQHLTLGRPLVRATLKLKYFDPVGYPHSGGNSMRISMCDTAWSEHQITWLNQPSPDPRLVIEVPAVTGFQDLSIDVLPMVLYQFYNGNNGMIINLIEESIFRMVLFGSRENEGYIPELELEFLDINSRCDTFSDPGELDLVQLNSSLPQSNLLNPVGFAIGSNPAQNFSIRRAVLKPDLTRLPPSVNITYANLRLTVFNDQQLPNGGNTSLSLFPLNQSVASNALNWNNQPSHTTQAAVHGLAPDGNFGAVNFNVKALLERSINLGQYHGYLLKQNNESQAGISYFAGTGFGSSPARPTLLVCYTLNSSVASIIKPLYLNVFPNPSDQEVNISFEANSGTSLALSITDMQGRLIYEQALNDPLWGTVQLKLSTAEFVNGVYTISVKHGSELAYQKLVVAH